MRPVATTSFDNFYALVMLTFRAGVCMEMSKCVAGIRGCGRPQTAGPLSSTQDPSPHVARDATPDKQDDIDPPMSIYQRVTRA
eukprot:4678187-Pyramimonas_sp.AAC.1